MAAAPWQFQNMPPLAAAATECRLRGEGTAKIVANSDASRPCSVRIHGDLVLGYQQREVGGFKVPRLVHEDPAKAFDQVFHLHDPATFFRSYSSCHEIIYQMLMQTPVVREFDLAPDNWENGFLPHVMAGLIVFKCRRDIDNHGSVARAVRCDLDLSLTVSVTAVFNEPRALLLACKEAAAAAQYGPLGTAQAAEGCCCICMDDFAAAPDDFSDSVRLPCAHAFHSECIVPWFYKAATCPLCRHDLCKYLTAVTHTAKGSFPGLGA